jgi:hypothetical protein
VLAWEEGVTGVSRGTKLHACEDARLMADELNREYPDIYHWAAPVTDAELASHAAQAARLMALERARARTLRFQFHKRRLHTV